MARIRSIHPSLFTDEAWVACAPLARVLYVGLLGEADDQGLFEWKPLQIKMRVLPADNADVPALLAELCAADLIADMTSEGKRLGAIRRFCKFQRPKKPTYVYHLPPEWREYVGVEDGDDPADNLRRELCESQGGRCFYCRTEITHYSKRATSLDIDHRVPTSQGGSDERENLVASCRACNRGKCDRSEAEWRAILRSRVATNGAKAEVAPQMEDGGGRKEEKVSDAIASSVAAGDDESDFEALWSAYPHFRGRSSKPKSRKAFWQTAPAERGGLAAAAARFKASGKLPPSGAAALEKWVEDERWRDWVDRAPVQVPTWGGPPAIRTAVGDEFATKYLDSCGWDAEAGAILAPRDFTVTQFERLSAQRRRLLSEAGVATIRVEHRERAA